MTRLLMCGQLLLLGSICFQTQLCSWFIHVLRYSRPQVNSNVLMCLVVTEFVEHFRRLKTAKFQLTLPLGFLINSLIVEYFKLANNSCSCVI